jgi:predicted thioesterase
VVHPFYSTFALGRDAEWCCRQFVLKCKEDHEEGIGTFLNIAHQSPALLGETVIIQSKISELKDRTIICTFEVKVKDRVIANGSQGQKLLLKSKIEQLKSSLR